MHKYNGSTIFKKDSTFCPRPGRAGSGVSLESINFPGYFIRHRHSKLYIHNDTSYQAVLDSTFHYDTARILHGVSGVDYSSQNALSSQRDHLQKEISDLERQKSSKEQEIRAANERAASLSTRESSLRHQLSQSKKDIDQLEKDLASKEKRSAEIAVQIRALNSDNSNAQSTMDQLSDTKQNLAEKSRSLAAEARQLEEEKARLEDNVTSLRGQITAYGNSIKKYEMGLEEQNKINSVIEKIKKKVAEINNKDLQQNLIQENIGYIRAQGNYCTAYRVESRKIRTAAHCIGSPEKLEEKDEYEFRNLAGATSRASIVTRLDRAQDTVELQLEKDVTNSSTLSYDYLDQYTPLYFLYFDKESNFAPTFVCHVQFYNEKNGYFFHNCPTHEGSSGGVFLQGHSIVGFHIGKVMAGDGLGVVHYIPDNGQFADILADTELEWNCDSNCVRRTSFHTPCPTWRNPGRMCRQEQKISNPACEAAKATDCARREAQRAIDTIVDGLKRGVRDLTNRRNQLKLSLKGLDKSLVDINKTVLGRNESVKKFVKEVDKAAVQADALRAKITRKVSLIDKQKEALGIALKLAQVSEADINNITDAIEKLESANTKQVSDNDAMKMIIEGLKDTKEALEKNVDQLGKHLARLESDTRKAMEKVGSGIEHVLSEAKDLGEEINSGLITLKRDISLTNAIKALKPVQEFLHKTIIVNLANAWGWLVRRFSESPPKGPKMRSIKSQMRQFVRLTESGHALIIAKNNGWLEGLLDSLLFGKKDNIHSDPDNPGRNDDQNLCIGSYCISPTVIGGIFAEAGMVCEKELFDRARAGVTGVHWVQIEPDEFCRLKHRHRGDRWSNGFNRTMQRSWCEAYWNLQRLNQASDNKPQTFKCVDTTPKLKEIRDRIQESNRQTKESLSPEIDPKYQELLALLEEYESPKESEIKTKLEQEILDYTQQDKDYDKNYQRYHDQYLTDFSVLVSSQENISFDDLTENLSRFEKAMTDLNTSDESCSIEKLRQVLAYYSNSSASAQILRKVNQSLKVQSDDLETILRKVHSWDSKVNKIWSKYLTCISLEPHLSEALYDGKIALFDYLSTKEEPSEVLSQQRKDPKILADYMIDRIIRVRAKISQLVSSEQQFHQKDLVFIRYSISSIYDPHGVMSPLTGRPYFSFRNIKTLKDSERLSDILDQIERIISPYLPKEEN